jgi:hypothetical protein
MADGVADLEKQLSSLAFDGLLVFLTPRVFNVDDEEEEPVTLLFSSLFFLYRFCLDLFM